jgi:hypothetical protein
MASPGVLRGRRGWVGPALMRRFEHFSPCHLTGRHLRHHEQHRWACGVRIFCAQQFLLWSHGLASLPAGHVTKQYADPPHIALYVAQLLVGRCTLNVVFYLSTMIGDTGPPYCPYVVLNHTYLH